MVTKIIRKRGFTLIELLVVIAIISMLASIAFSSLQIARAKARDVRRELDIKQMFIALQYAQNDTGKFPCHEYSDSSSGNFLQPLITAGYFKQKPTDPGANYYYYTSYKTSPGGQCGQIAHIDIDFENPGRTCPFGKFKTPTHCHIYYPNGLPCSDPYLTIYPSIPADCDAITDTSANNEY